MLLPRGQDLPQRHTVDEDSDAVHSWELESCPLELRLDARVVADAPEVQFSSEINDGPPISNDHTVDRQARLVERVVEPGFAVVRAAVAQEESERSGQWRAGLQY